DAASGSEVKRFAGHDSLVSAVAFTPDRKWAVSGGFDGAVILWKTATGEERRRWEGTAKYVTAVAGDPQGRTALIAADRHPDAGRGGEVKRFAGHDSLVSAVAFTPDRKWAVSGGFDGAVILWKTATGEELRRWEGTAKYVTAVAVDPQGKTALIAADRHLYLW